MATNFRRIINWRTDGLLSIKANDTLITWYCEITWQTKTTIISVSKATTLGRMVTYLEGFLTIRSYNALITCSCKVTWKTKTILYICYQSVYAHETLQDGKLFWRAPNNKFICLCDHLVLESYMINRNHYISTTTRVPMATKTGRMIT